MWIEIPYSSISERYPNEVKFIITKLRKGKSVHKFDDPISLTWGFYWAEAIYNDKPNLKTTYSRLKILIKAKKRHWQSDFPISNVPAEIKSFYKKRLKDQEIEKKRWETLSSEDRQKEFNQALDFLMGQPGFFIIQNK